MTGSVFCRYDLRTSEPDAARAFYSEVAGLDFADSPEEPSVLGAWLLHERARARGARPHWLGQIGVTDLDATLTRWIGIGAERLGPTVEASDRPHYAALRDAGGAVLAVSANPQKPRRAPVAWHHLHTRDLDRSWAVYSELFGWTHTETFNVPDLPGGHLMFGWEGSDKSIGSMANTARAPGVHTHWLFFFPVADIEGSLAKVRERRGRVVAEATTLPNGDRLAPCEDPQGGAFGLYQAAR
jgi:predicted enzyme related to lactoylglutathione lyase